jgi:ParB-like chromosome segregation protein Spo0J
MKGVFAVVLVTALKLQSIRLDLGTDAELIALAKSWLAQPIHPIIVRPDYTVADGHRRLKGMGLLGIKEVEVFVSDQGFTDDQLVEIGLLSAVHRKGLSDHERVQAINRIAVAHPDWSRKRLAEYLNIDYSMVGKLLPSGELIPDVEVAFKAEQIGIRDRYNISLVAPSEQHIPLELALEGASSDDVARECRNRRNGKRSSNGVPAVRTSKIKIPLATETATGTVTVAGMPEQNIDLEDAETLLKEALTAVRAAKGKLDTKTAQAVWRDMAKAGS